MAKLTTADKIVFFVAFCGIAVLFSYLGSSATSDRFVNVKVAGEDRYIVDLHEEKTLILAGELGDSQLQIQQGKIRFIHSPCNTQYCVRSGWLNQTMGLIACLPNKISVHFSEPSNLYDAINF